MVSVMAKMNNVARGRFVCHIFGMVLTLWHGDVLFATFVRWQGDVLFATFVRWQGDVLFATFAGNVGP